MNSLAVVPDMVVGLLKVMPVAVPYRTSNRPLPSCGVETSRSLKPSLLTSPELSRPWPVEGLPAPRTNIVSNSSVRLVRLSAAEVAVRSASTSTSNVLISPPIIVISISEAPPEKVVTILAPSTGVVAIGISISMAQTMNAKIDNRMVTGRAKWSWMNLARCLLWFLNVTHPGSRKRIALAIEKRFHILSGCLSRGQSSSLIPR